MYNEYRINGVHEYVLENDHTIIATWAKSWVLRYSELNQCLFARN